MKILITGSNGFLGRNMVEYIKTRELGEIIPFDLPNFDLLDYRKVCEKIEICQPDIVFHFAGLLKGTFYDLCKVNAIGTVNLYEAIAKFRPQSRIIVAGSASEYGFQDSNTYYHENMEPKPSAEYGRSKLMQTAIAEKYIMQGLNITVARVFNIIGVGLAEHLVVPSIIDRIIGLEGKPFDQRIIKVGNTQFARDFITINTLVKLFWFLAHQKVDNPIVNACSGEPITIAEIIELLNKVSSGFSYEVDPAFVRVNDGSVVGDTGKLQALGWNFQNEREKVFEEIEKMYFHCRLKRGEKDVK